MLHRPLIFPAVVLSVLCLGSALGQINPTTAPTADPLVWHLATQPAVRPVTRPANAQLRAGFAQVDITPDKDCSLLGYDFRQESLPPGNDGPRDPLYVRALALNDGGGLAVLISLDTCIMPTRLARLLRQQVAYELGTTADRVMICATHTHSGPFLSLPRLKKDQPLPQDWRIWPTSRPSARYTVSTINRVRQAAALASGQMLPVQVGSRQAPLGLGYNRRVEGPEGVKICWNPQEFPDRVPAGATDPTCGVLLLRQTNGPRQFMLWSLGMHPVTLGKTSRVVSADWPGSACKVIQDELADTKAMFVLGAAGDTQPWVSTQEDAKYVDTIGRAAGAFVATMAQAVPTGPAQLQCAQRTQMIGKVEVDLAVWRLGQTWIVALPGEIFGELAVDLRRRLGGTVILATVANGDTSYWPTQKAFSQGKYEVEAATQESIRPGDGERLVDAVIDLAATLKPGR